jgi:hypothetical protein
MEIGKAKTRAGWRENNVASQIISWDDSQNMTICRFIRYHRSLLNVEDFNRTVL